MPRKVADYSVRVFKGKHVVYEINPHRRKNYCIPSITTTNEVELPLTPIHDTYLCEVVMNCYPVLESIFRHLDYTELQNAKLVNWMWNRLANIELNKRNTVEWMHYSSNPMKRLHVSKNFRYIDTDISLVVYNGLAMQLKKSVCLHTNSKQSKMHFSEYILQEIVPPNGRYFIISCSAIPPLHLQEGETTDIFKAVRIPHIPNIRIATFSCNPTQNISILSESIKSNEEVKCVLVFTQHYKLRIMNIFLTELFKEQNFEDVAFGGGLIKYTRMHPNSIIEHSCAAQLDCMLFLQDKESSRSCNCYSIVIDKNYTLERRLLGLRKCSTFRKAGFIIRLVCHAKEAKNNESTIIAKHFPNYPIFELEVDGEIGWDTNESEHEESTEPSTSSIPSKRLKLSFPKILHIYSTVLIFITWGKEISSL